MLIDWFTVCAQVLNFLILVWLLKRFLYKPILHAIDEREKQIAAVLADADTRKTDAQRKLDEFIHKNDEFDRQRTALLTEVKEEVNAERQRLLEMARKESDAFRSMLKETAVNQRDTLHRNFMTRARQEIFAIVRKTLADLAGASLEERIAEVFIRRLHEMSEEEREILTKVLRSTSSPVLIRSAFNMPLSQRNAIHSAINEIMDGETKIRFESEPDLLSGIELITDGHKVAWSIAAYLESLEKSVDTIIYK
jgi:F-type H+-transporting ATPase subunit b